MDTSLSIVPEHLCIKINFPGKYCFMNLWLGETIQSVAHYYTTRLPVIHSHIVLLLLSCVMRQTPLIAAHLPMRQCAYRGPRSLRKWGGTMSTHAPLALMYLQRLLRFLVASEPIISCTITIHTISATKTRDSILVIALILFEWLVFFSCTSLISWKRNNECNGK